jgi:hypothetical protein
MPQSQIGDCFPDAAGIADGRKAASSQDKKACERPPHRAISQLPLASNWGIGFPDAAYLAAENW